MVHLQEKKWEVKSQKCSCFIIHLLIFVFLSNKYIAMKFQQFITFTVKLTYMLPVSQISEKVNQF